MLILNNRSKARTSTTMLLVKISLALASACLASAAYEELSIYPLPTIFPPPCYEICKGGKVCNYGKCVCPSGSYDINGKCVRGPLCRLRCSAGQICLGGKCVCRIGYLHQGVCVKCPAPKIFDSCATSCPRTCAHHPNEPIRCTKDCNRFTNCVCPKGYVQISEQDDRCVRIEKCPKVCKKKCPPNSRCVDGKCQCTRRCPPNQICVGGRCVCIVGYELVHGSCVKPDPCRLVRCYENSFCKDGKCICRKGFVRDEKTGRCVKLHPCATIYCGQYSTCRNGKCICNKGFIRDRKTGKCVLPCPRGKVFAPCRGCPLNCDTLDDPPPCPEICTPGCVCAGKDEVEISNSNQRCIKKSRCPSRQCPYPKKYQFCPTACPDNCENYRDPGPRICPAVCRPEKCVCPPPLIERSSTDFSCVRPSQCEKKCGKGYILVDGKCIDACAATLCLEGRICKLGECLCPDGSKEINGRCPKLCGGKVCKRYEQCIYNRCVNYIV